MTIIRCLLRELSFIHEKKALICDSGDLLNETCVCMTCKIAVKSVCFGVIAVPPTIFKLKL